MHPHKRRKKPMANHIKKYTKKDGSTAWMFNTYLGTDPMTGQTEQRTTRRRFFISITRS